MSDFMKIPSFMNSPSPFLLLHMSPAEYLSWPVISHGLYPFLQPKILLCYAALLYQIPSLHLLRQLHHLLHQIQFHQPHVHLHLLYSHLLSLFHYLNPNPPPLHSPPLLPILFPFDAPVIKPVCRSHLKISSATMFTPTNHSPCCLVQRKVLVIPYLNIYHTTDISLTTSLLLLNLTY